MQRRSKKYSTGKEGKHVLVIQHLKIDVCQAVENKLQPITQTSYQY